MLRRLLILCLVALAVIGLTAQFSAADCDVDCQTQALPPEAVSTPVVAAAQGPLVRAVLFWMPGCSHCHEVITTVLPPLQAKYGAQLEIKLLDATEDDNLKLYLAVVQAFRMNPENAGVPLMVIGDQVLLGSRQIPQVLPTLIETYLAAGGVDWPTAGGIAQRLQPAEGDVLCRPSEPCDDQPMAATSTVAPRTGFASGFALAMVVMAGMVAALAYSGVTLARAGLPQGPAPRLNNLVPILTVVGLAVASYLAYVETQAVEAVCGPVGDCNAVQSSPYAKLFGVLPVGVLGMLGYLAILVVWLYGRLRSDRLAGYAPYAVLAMTLFGTLFSLYLTFLEPFVIKAVCAWCLSSAVIMTLLLVIVARNARAQKGASSPWNRASVVQTAKRDES